MKKLLLIGTLIFSCLLVNAQDGLKGTWFAGGALKFQSVDEGLTLENEEIGDTYSVMPLVGKFISPSVAIGGALGYTHTKIGEVKSNAITIQPLARKYWNISGGLYFFGQAALPINFIDIKDGNNAFAMGVTLSPGFDLIVTDWLTVEASFALVSANYLNISPEEGDSVSAWSINGNSIGSTEFGKLTVGVKFLF